MSKNKWVLSQLEQDFAKVPNELARLGLYLTKKERRIYPYAIAVYLVFAGSAENFHPGQRYIRDALGLSKEVVRKALSFLEEWDLLKRIPTRNGQRAKYEFVPMSQWKAARTNAQVDIADQAVVQDGVDDITRRSPSYSTGHNNKKNKKKPIGGNPLLDTKGGEKSFGQKIQNHAASGSPYADLPQAQPDPTVLQPTHIAASAEDVFALVGLGKEK